jgi:hypothetical protein
MGRMGRERVALRARNATVFLLALSAFSCLFMALASLAGYVPYAPLPVLVLLGASVTGFVFSAVEGRRTVAARETRES